MGASVSFFVSDSLSSGVTVSVGFVVCVSLSIRVGVSVSISVGVSFKVNANFCSAYAVGFFYLLSYIQSAISISILTMSPLRTQRAWLPGLTAQLPLDFS